VVVSADEAATRSQFEATVRRFLSKVNDRPSRIMDMAAAIGAEIISGERAPGSDLNSVDLARKFGTSRTPVREALAVLEKEGLVELFSARRPRVAAFGVTETAELYEVRAAVVALVAHAAALRGEDSELDALEAIATQMQRAAQDGDFDTAYWCNVEFHEQLVHMARNATLQRILDTLVLRSLRMKRLSLSVRERLLQSAREHAWLAETLRKRNADLAAAIARANVSGSFHNLAAQLVDAGRAPGRRRGAGGAAKDVTPEATAAGER
jgi:DNA-binding GntR family transcriptional regulator